MPKSETPKKSPSSTAILTEERQRLIRAEPAFDPTEILRMLKPGEGFERVAPGFLEVLGQQPELAKLARADLPALAATLQES